MEYQEFYLTQVPHYKYLVKIDIIVYRDYRPQYEKLKREKEEEKQKQTQEQLSQLNKDMAEKGKNNIMLSWRQLLKLQET